MKPIFILALLALGIAGITSINSNVAADAPTTTQEKTVADALNFTVKDIDGKDVQLGDYQGKVILIVNVASKCGNTNQYKALQEMYDKYQEKGFVILGFPANNFRGQEPGSDKDIKKFCTEMYHVTFPMFSKVSAKGDDICDFYKYLIAQDVKPKGKGDVDWNFEKFLIGKDGVLIGRYSPKTVPDDKSIVDAVEAAIAK